MWAGIRLAVVLLIAAGAAKSGTLCAIVTDPTNTPVPTARVVLKGLDDPQEWEGRTDREGLACKEDLPEGWYALEVRTPGFIRSMQYPIQVFEEGTTRIPFRLTIGSNLGGEFPYWDAVLSGVLKTEEGSPLGLAEICFTRLGSEYDQPLFCIGSNQDGRYIELLPPGQYRIVVRDGEQEYSQEVTFEEPGFYRNVITLDKAASTPN